MIKVYFNPDCSKCNATECILIEQQIKFDKIEYLTNTPDKEELYLLLRKLGISAQQLVRTSEPIYKQNFEGKELTEEEWVEAMIQQPILIERPIVIDGERAIICRPAEKLYDFLKIG